MNRDEGHYFLSHIYGEILLKKSTLKLNATLLGNTKAKKNYVLSQISQGFKDGCAECMFFLFFND